MANPIQGYFNSTSYTLDVNGFPIWNMAVGSEFMAKFAHTVLGNGAAAVTTGGFQVVKKTGMTVTVKPYFICKNGYMMYQTAETDITFTSSTSKQVFYIGARLDVSNNHFTGDNVAAYTTFVSATDLASCRLTITANAVTITDGMIEDLRYNTAYCGQLDEYRERSLELIAELEDALAAVIGGGIPNHASTHATGSSDPITATSISAMPYNAIDSNLIINGSFAINQRAKSGTVVLSAGAYGHDRWKAGSSGCTYTFATSENITTITISAGSLIQVVEGLNLQTGTACLSWTGTAQGKIGAGIYSSSGITGSVTGGTNLNIEFGTGTLSKVQLNYGSVAFPFVLRSYASELAMCQRFLLVPPATLYVRAPISYYDANMIAFFFSCPVTMRANPTLRGTANTDSVVLTPVGGTQTGFSFTAYQCNGGILVNASKTSHGLTSAFMQVLGTNGGFEAEL